MNLKYIFVLVSFLAFVFFSCSKENDAKDAEETAIEKILSANDTGYYQEFDGIYLHIDTAGKETFNNGDLVKIIYVAKTLENTVVFGNKDTLITTYISDDLLEGWKIALQHLNKNSQGELIIPYNLGFGDKRTGLVEPYSTLYYQFIVLGK